MVSTMTRPILLLILAAIACFVSTSDACTCQASEFCNSTSSTTILARVTITGISQVGDDLTGRISYSADVSKYFKSDEDYGDSISISTASSSSRCGVSLDLDEEYLLGITPSSTFDRLEIFSCGPNYEWDELTYNQRKVLWNGGECL